MRKFLLIIHAEKISYQTEPDNQMMSVAAGE